jgi:hypothetical protein
MNNSKDGNATKISAPIVGWINLTNSQINESRYFHNETIIIRGRYYFAPTNASISGANVSLLIDKKPYKKISNITDVNGLFELYYVIPDSTNIYVPYIFEVEVNNPGGTVKYLNYFNISYGAFSYFDIIDPSEPKLNGELIEFEGYLRYDNGTVINSTNINYFWYENTNIISSGSVFTESDGEIPNIQIPDNDLNHLQK